MEPIELPLDPPLSHCTKLASNSCHFDLQIDNANIERLPQLINSLNNHFRSSKVNGFGNELEYIVTQFFFQL